MKWPLCHSLVAYIQSLKGKKLHKKQAVLNFKNNRFHRQIETREMENDRKREVWKLCPWSHTPAISIMGERTRKKHARSHAHTLMWFVILLVWASLNLLFEKEWTKTPQHLCLNKQSNGQKCMCRLDFALNVLLRKTFSLTVLESVLRNSIMFLSKLKWSFISFLLYYKQVQFCKIILLRFEYFNTIKHNSFSQEFQKRTPVKAFIHELSCY